MKYVLVSACLLGVHCRYDGKGNENASVTALLKQDDVCLVPVCPEQLGGLSTPRIPSECLDGKVVSKTGTDVTKEFSRGAEQALKIAQLYGCHTAVLKERSPSCGYGRIYDGTFSKTLTDGSGMTARLLGENGIKILTESNCMKEEII